MKALVSLLAVSLGVILSWAWRGAGVPMPASPLAAGERLQCVSYAPFRGNQTPLDPTTVIPSAQIDADLAHLATLTDCVRTYSTDMGLERVPELAERHGLKVLLGIWISSDARKNEQQIKAGVALANRYPKTISGVIVGNEVLLRGEMTASTLEGYIRQVRSQVPVPVTYADVWEYWLQNRALLSSVDFVTVHILPYWEDIPIPAADAGPHTASIRARVGAEFAGKEVLIGEAGWPSHGRMREAARASPADQARVLHDLVALAHTQKFKINLIEAFDQPWKRHLEGTVGGYWGLFNEAREVKFAWGKPVSNHPRWPWQAFAGVLLAAAVFALGIGFGSDRSGAGSSNHLGSISLIALVGGALAPAAAEAAVIEALGIGGALRSGLLMLVAIAAPLAAAAALRGRICLPAAETIIGPRDWRVPEPRALALGFVLIVTSILAAESALGLTFNPRYLNFPYAALASAVVPLLLLTFAVPSSIGRRPRAEMMLAILLAVCAVKIVWAESSSNWEAIWLCAAFAALAVTLVRVRGAPG